MLEMLVFIITLFLRVPELTIAFHFSAKSCGHKIFQYALRYFMTTSLNYTNVIQDIFRFFKRYFLFKNACWQKQVQSQS